MNFPQSLTFAALNQGQWQHSSFLARSVGSLSQGRASLPGTTNAIARRASPVLAIVQWSLYDSRVGVSAGLPRRTEMHRCLKCVLRIAGGTSWQSHTHDRHSFLSARRAVMKPSASKTTAFKYFPPHKHDPTSAFGLPSRRRLGTYICM